MDTLFVGTNTIHLSEVDSTNSYANALLKDVKPPEGTLVWADHQTAGRGMRGNVWATESLANITASYILYPSFLTASNHFMLSKSIALAIHDTLTEVLVSGNYDIKIKWPNDILVNGKKIAGVLIENAFREDRIHASIAGIGINVNQQNFGELTNKATSLHLLAGMDFQRKQLLKKLSKHLEVVYLRLKQGKMAEINERYLKYLLYLDEETTFFDVSNAQNFRGRIIDVKENGTLEILSLAGTIRHFDMKEIRFAY